MRSLLIVLASLTLTAASAVSASAPVTKTTTATFKGSELASDATVSMATARASALKARPGNVTDAELEKESGGSGLRYSFDISSHGKPYEVGIDAKTGKLLENKAEGRHPD